MLESHLISLRLFDSSELGFNFAVLQLCCNHLTGSIPREMGLLKRLSVVALESNSLTGQIPSSFGDLGLLERVYLSFNHLSGPIPVRLANLPSLEILDVQNNTLSGVVPSGERSSSSSSQFQSCKCNFQ